MIGIAIAAMILLSLEEIRTVTENLPDAWQRRDWRAVCFETCAAVAILFSLLAIIYTTLNPAKGY